MKEESKEQVIGLADPEQALHEGKHHEEEEEKENEEEEEEEEETNMDPSRELEAALHGDDGHAHEKPQVEEVKGCGGWKGKGRSYGKLKRD